MNNEYAIKPSSSSFSSSSPTFSSSLSSKKSSCPPEVCHDNPTVFSATAAAALTRLEEDPDRGQHYFLGGGQHQDSAAVELTFWRWSLSLILTKVVVANNIMLVAVVFWCPKWPRIVLVVVTLLKVLESSYVVWKCLLPQLVDSLHWAPIGTRNHSWDVSVS